jgi:hypothetical protein
MIYSNKCQALTITRLTYSPYVTNTARIRPYPMLSTIFKCKIYYTYYIHIFTYI